MKSAIAQVLREFRRLSPVKQAAIVAVTAWNVWLSGAAQLSIQRTAPERIRGPKALWRLACLTNTVGPLAYFRWGRRGDEADR
jgi:hypothetical protein